MVDRRTKLPTTGPRPNSSPDSDAEIMQEEELVTHQRSSSGNNGWYLLAGIAFGIILVKSEVISWFRIQEMFRLQSFHMYGVIGSAVIVAMISLWVIKKFGIKTIHGETIRFYPRKFTKGHIFGGLMFGFGWALAGACPGPLYAQIGSGFTVVIVTLASAIAGTWTYGLLRPKLPH